VVIIILFFLFAKFLSIMTPVAVGAGGVKAWCDCEYRNWTTPFQKHVHGFGLWYETLIWLHVIMAALIIPPVFIGVFAPKGTKLHMVNGRIFIGLWVAQMTVGIICGSFVMLARGPFPGGDPNHKETEHYWGSFSLYIFYLFSFVLSSAADQLLSATASLQYKTSTPNPWISGGLIVGSVMTLFNGVFMFSIAMFTLVNHPAPGSDSAFYPWLYFVFAPVEMLMAFLNLRYWVHGDSKDWILTHIRCMGWSCCLTLFFVIENTIFRICTVTGWSLLLLFPGWGLVVGSFAAFIIFYTKRVKDKKLQF